MKSKGEQWNGEIYKDPSYSRLQRFFGKKIIDTYLVTSNRNKGRGLDIGCGDGTLTRYVSQRLGMKFHGIDNSPSMIRTAKEHESDDDRLIFSSLDITAKNLHFYGQYPVVMSLLCLHWVVEQDKALTNIKNALQDNGYGFLFISAKSTIPSKNSGYIEIIRGLIQEEKYRFYFQGINISRAHLNKENYPKYIEESGLKLRELIEINEPFIFENKEELSKFFQGIVSGFMIFNKNLTQEEAFLQIELLCNDLVEQLIRQGNYQALPNGSILSDQKFLLAIVQKPVFSDCYDVSKINTSGLIVTQFNGHQTNTSLDSIIRFLNSGPPSANTRSHDRENQEGRSSLALK